MSVKPPAAAQWTAVAMGILCAVALIDDLGKFRWFWPYDKTVYGLALFAGILWYAVFGRAMEAWFKQAQAKQDLEDFPDEFKER